MYFNTIVVHQMLKLFQLKINSSTYSNISVDGKGAQCSYYQNESLPFNHHQNRSLDTARASWLGKAASLGRQLDSILLPLENSSDWCCHVSVGRVAPVSGCGAHIYQEHPRGRWWGTESTQTAPQRALHSNCICSAARQACSTLVIKGSATTTRQGIGGTLQTI